MNKTKLLAITVTLLFMPSLQATTVVSRGSLSSTATPPPVSHQGGHSASAPSREIAVAEAKFKELDAQYLDDQNPDVEAQTEGHYPNLERQEMLPLGAIQHAWDGSSAKGVYNVTYSPSEVIKLRVREFMTTTVILPSWETIEEVMVGDESSFQVQQPKDNLLMIKPKQFVGVDTSITVVGASGNVYPFYIRAEGYNSRHVPDVTVYVRASAPETTLTSLPETQSKQVKVSRVSERSSPNSHKTDYLEALPVRSHKLRFDYTMSGDKAIAPERVFSDGIRTWLDYGDRWDEVELPTIYRITDGVDTPVNTRKEGHMLVAETGGAFTLRHGQKIACIHPATWQSEAVS